MPRKQRTGLVVSDKMDKTVVVTIERTVTHPLYKKVLRRRKRLKAHDETNVCALGDTVLIEECRPLAKDKHWRVVQIIERREVADIQPREIEAPSLDDDETPAAAAAPASEAAPDDDAPPDDATPDDATQESAASARASGEGEA